jgi:hypothetical protein
MGLIRPVKRHAALAWKIGVPALAAALALASLTHGHVGWEKRALARTSCYVALANDLTPLLTVGTAAATTRGRAECIDDSRT